MGRMEVSEGGKWDNCNSIINKYILKIFLMKNNLLYLQNAYSVPKIFKTLALLYKEVVIIEGNFHIFLLPFLNQKSQLSCYLSLPELMSRDRDLIFYGHFIQTVGILRRQ